MPIIPPALRNDASWTARRTVRSFAAGYQRVTHRLLSTPLLTGMPNIVSAAVQRLPPAAKFAVSATAVIQTARDISS